MREGAEFVMMDDDGDAADVGAEARDGADVTMHDDAMADAEGSVNSDGDEEPTG